MTNLLSDADVSVLIKPYEQAISDAVIKAWKLWLGVPNRAMFCNRTRANIVWDYAVGALEEALDPLPGIHVNRSGNTCIFMLSQQLAFRFKKADEKGLSRNYPTAMALAFHDPEQQVLGIPEALKTEIIYILNKLETEILHVKLVRRDGESVAWAHTIYDRSNSVAQIPTVIPSVPAKDLQGSQSPKRRRATVKKDLVSKRPENEVKPARPSS